MTTPLHSYRLYSDESHTNQHDFFVIGAVVGSHASMDRLERRINSLPEADRPQVMKWRKMRSQKLRSHIAALEIFFELNRRHEIDFHALVLQSSRVNHAKFNKGDGELGFGRFMYYLYKSIKNGLGRQSSFHCYPDFRKTTYDLDNLKRILNNTWSNFEPGQYYQDRSFREIRWCNEEDCRAAQINDLLSGAVGFLVNEKRSRGRDNSKEALANFVLHESPHLTFACNSDRNERNFRIWYFALAD